MRNSEGIMYWFKVIEILRTENREMDIYEIASKIDKPNIRNLRKTLLKLYLKHPCIERRIVRNGSKHYYVYSYNENHIKE